MTGSDNIRRQEGVIVKNGTCVKGEFGTYPLNNNSDPLTDGTKVWFYCTWVGRTCYATGIREARTKSTPYLARDATKTF